MKGLKISLFSIFAFIVGFANAQSDSVSASMSPVSSQGQVSDMEGQCMNIERIGESGSTQAAECPETSELNVVNSKEEKIDQEKISNEDKTISEMKDTPGDVNIVIESDSLTYYYSRYKGKESEEFGSNKGYSRIKKNGKGEQKVEYESFEDNYKAKREEADPDFNN